MVGVNKQFNVNINFIKLFRMSLGSNYLSSNLTAKYLSLFNSDKASV